ncbi:hypothetical protein A7K50_12785 [Dehalobacter sp. MCB1]|nr:hypothetical protein A7K50_12785 [Dehalobacter sp. MCB1]TCX47400.1 hypothetical protein C1I36_13955 [Dehalobacter sp. 14DCB1]TCX55613.1 hypothetical protein C1I38_02920 [Dehalobacter sp. 12DCB1]
MNMKIKEKVRDLKSKIAALFLAYKRKDTPLAAKIVAALTVGYALSPIDIIPDFVPVLGYLDDIIILPLLITWAIKLIPDYIMEECLEQAKGMWSEGKPKKWRYAIPIICIWVFIIAIIVYIILN